MNAWKIALPGMLALAAIAACGGDDDDGADHTPGVGDTLPAGETPLQEDVAVDVIAREFEFDPGTFDFEAGDVVRFNFRNEGEESHTMTIFRDAQYSEPLEGATTGQEDGIQTFTFLATFDEAGTYYFHCDFHPTNMHGTIEVQ